MFDFVKRLFAGPTAASPAPQPQGRSPSLPPALPPEGQKAFLDWHEKQAKPAVALTPDRDRPFEAKGSRLFGPALLKEGEEWPKGANGKPLMFLAQINCEDCETLQDYPKDGILQFFIGLGDLYGMNFENLTDGDFLVRWIDPEASVTLYDPPQKEDAEGSHDDMDDYSPVMSDTEKATGIPLVAKPDTSYPNIGLVEVNAKEAELEAEYGDFDFEPIWDAVWERSLGAHHTGGYPAYTQSDVREDKNFADYNHVLLRLTSDDHFMWGDAGECVFLMRPDDLAERDFSKVAYSWDCS